jgi:rubrerythrin
MVSKKELLKMLHEAISLEEHIFVLEYSKFLEAVEDQGVRKLLKTLIKDSGYHALALGQTINEVKESEVDEW